MTQWNIAMENLMRRRRDRGVNNDNTQCLPEVSDYLSHMSKVKVGKTLLDVGCGDMTIKRSIDPHVQYYGLDPFPVSDEIISGCIEDPMILHLFTETVRIETVCAFAMLDGCKDFNIAIRNMKLIAQKNVVILTGIGIDRDIYHTFRLELADFDCNFDGWTCTHREEISPKVFLLQYEKL